jgi:hypothetical protein
VALPPGITPKTVTVGTAGFFDGSVASGTVTITAPVNVIHTPTNRPIFSSDMSQPLVAGAASFLLCPTDADGLNRVDWTYKLRIVISNALVQPDPIYFILPQSGPDTVDLDGLVTVPSSAGIPVGVDLLARIADLEAALAAKADLVDGALDPSQMPALTSLTLIDQSSQQSAALTYDSATDRFVKVNP